MFKNRDETNPSHNNSPRRVKLFFVGEADTPAARMEAIRQLRKGQILNYLLQQGQASRVDISRALGFNLRTVSLLVASLVEDNLVIEKPVLASSSMGRRPVPLELNARAATILAIDVRRQTTVMALVDLNGQVLIRTEQESSFGDTPEGQARWLVDAALAFLAEHHGELPPLGGAGLSAEGFAFRQHVAHRHAAVTEPMRLALEEALQVPVASDSDSRLIAIAEQWFGQEARGKRNTVILNIGEGLGAGCVVDGKIMCGVNGYAGELGHIPMGDPGVPCYCGASGCLENVVSGSGLKRLAAQYCPVPCKEEVDTKTVIEHLLRVPKGRTVLDKFVHHLALAVTVVENLFDPGTIVLGGPVAPLLAPLHSQILEKLDQVAVPFIQDKNHVGFSTLADDAILMGAAGLVLTQIYSASHVAAESLL